MIAIYALLRLRELRLARDPAGRHSAARPDAARGRWRASGCARSCRARSRASRPPAWRACCCSGDAKKNRFRAARTAATRKDSRTAAAYAARPWRRSTHTLAAASAPIDPRVDRRRPAWRHRAPARTRVKGGGILDAEQLRPEKTPMRVGVIGRRFWRAADAGPARPATEPAKSRVRLGSWARGAGQCSWRSRAAMPRSNAQRAAAADPSSGASCEEALEVGAAAPKHSELLVDETRDRAARAARPAAPPAGIRSQHERARRAQSGASGRRSQPPGCPSSRTRISRGVAARRCSAGPQPRLGAEAPPPAGLWHSARASAPSAKNGVDHDRVLPGWPCFTRKWPGKPTPSASMPARRATSM